MIKGKIFHYFYVCFINNFISIAKIVKFVVKGSQASFYLTKVHSLTQLYFPQKLLNKYLILFWSAIKIYIFPLLAYIFRNTTTNCERKGVDEDALNLKCRTSECMMMIRIKLYIHWNNLAFNICSIISKANKHKNSYINEIDFYIFI